MAKKLGEFWMGMNAGDHTNQKQDQSMTIAIADLKPGAGHVQGSFSNSGGGDTSNLSAGDIPDGIFIECDGSDSNGWGWSVVKPWGRTPILAATDFDSNYIPHSLQFTLGLYLHCDNPLAGGGNVRVQVFAA